MERDSKPLHPGEYLIYEVLPEIEHTMEELAEHLDIPLEHLEAIVSSVAPITIEIAHKLSDIYHHPPSFWLSLQRTHDMWVRFMD